LHPNRAAIIAHTAPFAAFIALLGLERAVSLPPQLFYPIRLSLVALLLLLLARPYLSFRPSFPLASLALGALVFLVWIAPDILFGYRHFWLFENVLTGHPDSALAPALRHNLPFILVRATSCTLLVPVFEELFWRSWLMRWLIKPHFLTIPFGFYTRYAFWSVALLFAAEHGPYWEVGLAAGVLYNWWAVRTRSLADCILAHAVTNGLLSVYVLMSGHWEYWL
jgi:uncharacterized protein